MHAHLYFCVLHTRIHMSYITDASHGFPGPWKMGTHQLFLSRAYMLGRKTEQVFPKAFRSSNKREIKDVIGYSGSEPAKYLTAIFCCDKQSLSVSGT